MDYKYNEREYAKKIKSDGFQTRFIRRELIILVKYLKELGYSKQKTEEYLYKFCKDNIEGFNEVKYYKTIDNSIRDGRKSDNKLIVIQDLPITKSELEYIDRLEIDNEYKKLLLALLVKRKIAYEINKIHNGDSVEISAYFNGNKKTFREVFKNSNITKQGYKIDDMISNLVQLGIIQSIIKGDIVLSYMYDIYETSTEYVDVKNNYTKEIQKQEKKHIKYKIEENDIFYKLNEFDNIGYIFDYYKNDSKIKICENEGCTSLFKAKSNRQKYCPECWKEIRETQNRKKALKYYHKTKNFTS